MGDLSDDIRFGLILEGMSGDLNVISPFTGMSTWGEAENKAFRDKDKLSYLWDKFYEQAAFARSAIKKKKVRAGLVKVPENWDSSKTYSERPYVYVDKDRLPWNGYVCYSGPLKNLEHRVLKLLDPNIEVINNKGYTKVEDVNTGEVFKLKCNYLTYPGMLNLI
jgi:hypothetical protein